MSMIAGARTLLSGFIAGLSLVLFAANPSFANTHSEKATANRAELVRQLLNQRKTPTNQPSPQTSQMECSCCKSMMNNMPGRTNSTPGMMHNTPSMMDSQNK